MLGIERGTRGSKSALWLSSRQGLFQQQPSLLGLTVICPLLLTCLFTRIVQQSFKLPGAFTVSLGEDAQLLASASRTVRGIYSMWLHTQAGWLLHGFNKIVICLNSQTRVNFPVTVYLHHVCQNKPLKVLAKTAWHRTPILQTC